MPTWKSVPATSTYPLTSIFTAPDWCSSLLYTWHPLPAWVTGPSIFLRAQHGQYSFADKYSDCYPPNFATVAALNRLPYEQTFTKFWDVVTAHTVRDKAIYSPGVCPSGWSSWPASTSTNVYICCPLGFYWKDWQACKSSPTTATVVALNAQSETRTIHPPYILADWPLVIAYASSDLDDFHPASAPLLLHKINEESDSNAPNRLSTGAKAGIGVGVTFACVALIALLAAMLLLRCRRKKLEGNGFVNKTKTKEGPDPSTGESQEAVNVRPKSGSNVETTEIAKATNTSNSAGTNYAIGHTAGLHRRTTL